MEENPVSRKMTKRPITFHCFINRQLPTPIPRVRPGTVKIHVRCDLLISEKVRYPASLWSQSSLLSSVIPYSRLQRVTIPDAVTIQFVLLKTGMLMLETCRGLKCNIHIVNEQRNCALKLVNEISLYYETRKKKKTSKYTVRLYCQEIKSVCI
jgi:hypothetical protein